MKTSMSKTAPSAKQQSTTRSAGINKESSFQPTLTSPNITTLNQCYEYFNNCNIPEIVEHFAETGLMRMGTSQVKSRLPFVGTFKGKDSILQFFQEMDKLMKCELSVEDVVEIESNKLLVVLIAKIHGKNTGNKGEERICHIVKFNHQGMMTNFEVISDHLYEEQLLIKH